MMDMTHLHMGQEMPHLSMSDLHDSLAHGTWAFTHGHDSSTHDRWWTWLIYTWDMSFTQDQCHSRVSYMDMTRLRMGHGPFTYESWGQCLISRELHTRPMPNRPLISSALPLPLSLRKWASRKICVNTLNSRMVVIIHTALLLYNLTVNIELFLYIQFDNSLVRICRALLAVNAYAWVHIQGSFECTGLCWYTDFDKVCFANILGLFVMSNLTTFVCKVRSLKEGEGEGVKEGEGEGVKEGDLWLILRESGRTWLVTLMSHVKAAHVLCVKESHPYMGHGSCTHGTWRRFEIILARIASSRSPTLPLSHTHTRTHTPTHKHTHAHTRTHERTHTDTNKYIDTHKHKYMHTNTHMNTYTYAHTPPLQDQACPRKVACRQWPSAWMKKATWSFLGWLQ